MPNARDLRRAELVAAAVAGQLDDAEGRELDTLRADDPTVDAEIAELSDTAGLLSRAVPGWDAGGPSAALRDRIAAIAAGTEGATDDAAPAPLHAAEQREPQTFAPSDPRVTPFPAPAPAPAGAPRTPAAFPAASPAPSRRGRWIVGVAAAACIGLGAGVGIGIGAAGPSLPQAVPPSEVVGEPGVLGAVEPIAFAGSPAGVDIDGALIAHTWGTETVLHIEGLPAGAAYGLVLVTETGEQLDSGSFLGSDVAIDCEMNAAVMRASVASVVIEDASGATVATAELPAVS